jgi:hypothetical protein
MRIIATRRQLDQTLDLKTQQSVSAFISEINLILNELRECLRPAIENALRTIESGREEVDDEVVRIGKHLVRLFHNSPIRVRLLPKLISGQLTRFYYLIEEMKSDLDWYYRAIELNINSKVRIMNYSQLTRLLKRILIKLNSCDNLGRSLLGELEKIRFTVIESPDQPQTPRHRLRINCAPGSWYHKLVSNVRESRSSAEPSNQPPHYAAKLRLAMLARSWLSKLTPFTRTAKLRLAMCARSWLSELLLFARAAKLHLAMPARSWLSELIPFARAAKLHLAMPARSWLSKLILFARAAKVRSVMHARSWLSGLTPFARAASHLDMPARSWLRKHAIQGPRPLGPAIQKERMMARHANAPPLTQEPPRELSELPARDPPANQVMHARARLASFTFVRFLIIFIAGVVATLAWQSWGGAALKTIGGAAKDAICSRSAGSPGRS